MPTGAGRDAEQRIAALEAENRALRLKVGELPSSLDRLYPPSSDRPVWHLAMLDMADGLDALVCDVLEQDQPGVRAAYDEFRRRYEATAALVPEWKEDFPREPLDTLGASLQTADPGQILPTLQAVDRVCSACHEVRMAPAQQRYHWGDFRAVPADDPETGAEVPMKVFMQTLAMDMTAVGHDLAQGQIDAARRHVQRLRAEFDTMADVCGACHTTPRAYYVGDHVRGLLDQVQEEIGKASPDEGVVGDQIRALGARSCLPCHRVHVPAAFASGR